MTDLPHTSTSGDIISNKVENLLRFMHVNITALAIHGCYVLVTYLTIYCAVPRILIGYNYY